MIYWEIIFYFVSNNGSIEYIFKPIENGYQSRTLSPNGNFNTWERLDQIQREEMLRKFFRESRINW
jgi:hypothetical protein